jgi:hypothetical protein
LSPTNALTLEAWVKGTSNGDLITKFSGTGYFLTYLGGSGVEFGIYNGSSNAYKLAGPNIADSLWYHVAGVYNGTTLKTYIDGVEYPGTLYGTVPSSIPNNSQPFSLAQNTTGNGYFGGALDEVRVYSTALSQSQIQADMNATSLKSADLNSDGVVNSVDFGILMSYWGNTSKPKADLNQDGYVNSVDFGIMMSEWG